MAWLQRSAIYENMESKKRKIKTKTKTSANAKQGVAELKKQCQEYLDGWQRERANFQNYKQSNEKYAEEVRSRTKESVIFQLLSIIDNMHLIVQHTPADVAGTEWYKGVEYVYKQVQQVFDNLGVKEVDCSGAFNPSVHEAVDGQGEVIDVVVQKGYMVDNNIIRPAKVKVKHINNKTT